MAIRSPEFEVISARPMPPVALAMLDDDLHRAPSTAMRLALTLAVSVTLHLWLLPIALTVSGAS